LCASWYSTAKMMYIDGMPVPHVPPASDVLREKRKSANWSRLFASPIRLRDGAVLFTLKDAADRILKAPASPSCRVAAQRIIDAALRGGDMASAQAAVRLALLKHKSDAALGEDNLIAG
jgi:hypothetical protein